MYLELHQILLCEPYTHTMGWTTLEADVVVLYATDDSYRIYQSFPLTM